MQAHSHLHLPWFGDTVHTTQAYLRFFFHCNRGARIGPAILGWGFPSSATVRKICVKSDRNRAAQAATTTVHLPSEGTPCRRGTACDVELGGGQNSIPDSWENSRPTSRRGHKEHPDTTFCPNTGESANIAVASEEYPTTGNNGIASVDGAKDSLTVRTCHSPLSSGGPRTWAPPSVQDAHKRRENG